MPMFQCWSNALTDDEVPNLDRLVLASEREEQGHEVAEKVVTEFGLDVGGGELVLAMPP